MKLFGTYKFYQNGELIAEQENKLTETGRILALKTLMGAIPNFGGSIAVGIDETANTVSGSYATNKRLGFRVCSSPVISSNASVSSGKDLLVFKARIDDPSSYRIREVGLFADPLPAGATTNRLEVLLNFEDSEGLVFGGASSELIDSTDATYGSFFRNGNSALKLVAGETVTSNTQISGLETFDNEDFINFAYYAAGTGSVDVTFYVNASNYSTFRFSHTGAGYKVSTLKKGSTPQASSGTLGDWSNISYVSFTANTAVAVLDGIRFENAEIQDTNNGMISRTALSSAIEKYAGIPIDIEYSLRVDFNG